MRVAPTDLSISTLATELERRWGFAGLSFEYAPLGFGSQHWISKQDGEPRLFVTADNLAAAEEREPDTVFRELSIAFETARSLRDADLDFVVAPIPGKDSRALQRISDKWALTVFDYIKAGPVAGAADSLSDMIGWADREAAAQAAVIVGRLHCHPPPADLVPFKFSMAFKDTVLDGLDSEWKAGPFGEQARALLASAHTLVESAMSRYDSLLQTYERDEGPLVLSHGEPHSGNFLRLATDRLWLIDWDTVKLAAPERDLASLPIEEPAILDAYLLAGDLKPPRPDVIELFRLWWKLSEICEAAHIFRGPHEHSDDNKLIWSVLRTNLTKLNNVS